jgi:ATP-dependent Lhr-like helicase
MRNSLWPELVKEKGKVKQDDPMRGLKRKPEREPNAELPEPFAGWFVSRGWRPHTHQLQLLDLAREGRDTLLIAPTGGGKTLAGFLPSLVNLTEQGAKQQGGIHTLYVSPLKALAVDIARNLAESVAEMGLPIKLETRTGDTPPSRRQRQRVSPPKILLTTPEQIALMLSHRDAPTLFGSLSMVIIDELHALASTKRGDLLALDLARLRRLSPNLTAIGLSATVARPSELGAFLVGHEGQGRTRIVEILEAQAGPKADIAMLDSEAELPWAFGPLRAA